MSNRVLNRFFRRGGPYEVVHKDKLTGTETFRHWGNQRIASKRMPQAELDIKARVIDANVAIATRAISEAVRMLQYQIVSIETVNNVETKIPDMEHEANALIKHPNPDITMRELLQFNTISLLGDGNAYNTIELITGPNRRIEVWPRDPRPVTRILNPKGVPGDYQIISGSNKHIIRRQRMIHIKDIDITDPIYGKPRHEAVRSEIHLDRVVNQFNTKFFEQGATLNAMFTPKEDMTEDQHKQLVDAYKDEAQGVDNAFGLFINRFAGLIVHPDQKHKDLSFLDLLKHNREKIFGNFGLPPFRGGVMEFANYANALIQDKDFWQNTIKPIVAVLLDGFNKQLIWPFFGDDIALSANYDDVAALKGDPKMQMEVHQGYKAMGALTLDEIREEIGRDPLPEADKEPEEDEAKTDKERERDDEKKGASPSKEEKDNITGIFYNVMRAQRRDILGFLQEHSVQGKLMHRVRGDERTLQACYKHAEVNGAVTRKLMPKAQAFLRIHGSGIMRRDTSGPSFKYNTKQITKAERLVKNIIYQMNNETKALLSAVLDDCDRSSWKYNELRRQVGALFSHSRAEDYSTQMLNMLSVEVIAIVHKQRSDNDKAYIDAHTKQKEVCQ